jgi:flagellar basal body-associated protein FliL
MSSALSRSGQGCLIRHLGAVVALTAALTAADARGADAPTQAAHKTTTSETFVSIDPIYSTILDGVHPRGLLMVELGLDVPDAKFRNDVNASMPRLRDAYVRGLLTYAATAVRANRQPNVEDIATRLQTITDTVMGAKGAQVLMAQTAIRVSR